ncbi:MAG: hypothetical protein AMS26_00765 [Bacteroides sp. SM23_62]|nr:MAG: hypothetical protein AMS26_00765 [Bacteroides sp. SM23_62]
MKNKNILLITPKSKIGELLEAYPELEEVLFSLSPSFKKLKNPALRKTIGKVATLQQVARVGNLSIDSLVNELRKRAGQETLELNELYQTESVTKPDWVKSENIKFEFDAIPVINAGENPMGIIFEYLDNLGNSEILLFKTPFFPAPILEKIKRKGFATFTLCLNENEFDNYIQKEH